MNYFLQKAKDSAEEIRSIRRTIHKNGGTGFDLRENADYIISELKKSGIEAQELFPCGIVATIGHGGKCLLLRADYDALPITEESGLDFAATNGTCHACGHDINAACLLFAAKMLKERESELKGTVKLMFQPAEELGAGAKKMIEAGVLENPPVDASIACHVSTGADNDYVGGTGYVRGPMFAACDHIDMVVRGKGGHGAFPHCAANPINTAALVIAALNSLVSNEVDSAQRAVLSFGSIHGGNAANVIPEEVAIKGTLRTVDKDVRKHLKERIRQISADIAAAFQNTIELDLESSSLPGITTDAAFCDSLHPYLAEVCGEENVDVKNHLLAMGSEDYAEIADRVPSVICWIGAGTAKQGYVFPPHHPKIVFNEECLPYGAAMYANMAFGWLNNEAQKKETR